jgi:type IV pilus assembly protein PilY1
MPAQGILTTYTTYTADSTDTYGYLLDANCNVLTQNDNSGDLNNYRIQRNVGPGTYYIAVRHSEEVAGTGTYNLVVESVLTYVITANSGYGGTISPSGSVSVPDGGNQSFDIEGSGLNAILRLEVDGSEIVAAAGQTTYTYGFTNVTENHTITVAFDLPQDACVDISDTPLDAMYQAAPANIMFAIDDSGSMDWEFLTTESDGLFRPHGRIFRYVLDDAGDNEYSDVLSRGDTRKMWQSQWHGYNRLYYNPAMEYGPWPLLGDADPDWPRSHPINANPTFNLDGSYDTVRTGGSGSEVLVDNDDYAPTFTMIPEASPIVVNDADSAFTKSGPGGGWKKGSDGDAYNNDYYYTDRDGVYTATWNLTVPAGDYDVYARWKGDDSFSDDVPYTVYYAGGASNATITVEQDDDSGKWVKLGTFTFTGAAGEKVEMNFTRTSALEKACADAVSLIPKNVGWDLATNTQAYRERYLYTAATGFYTATWTPDIPETGEYKVYARWVSGADRSTSVPYTIPHRTGEFDPTPVTTIVTVDQRQNGGQWVDLGTFWFTDGTGGNVRINNVEVTDLDADRVVADAINFSPPDPAEIDIKNSHYYVWSASEAKPYLVNLEGGAIKYYVVNNIDINDPFDSIQVGDMLPSATPPADVQTSRTYAEERQNFANWYSYNRRRSLTTIDSVADVINRLQSVNIGLFSVNENLIQPVLKVKVGGVDETDILLNRLYSLPIRARGTTLRKAVDNIGRYFNMDDADTGGVGASPWASDVEGGECQQAFTIVMTDGYYNGQAPSVGNTDGDNNTDFDGPPYADDHMNTLADLAMHYYENDLASTLADLVPTNSSDSATHQHMVTFGVSFGVFGTLDPDDYDTENGVFPTWPNPKNGDQEKIDDLYHAAVNGRGKFLSASNPEELSRAMLQIMQIIVGRIGHASSVSINGDELYDEVGTDIRMFQASYNSDGWTGDVKAYAVDVDTGSVVTDTYIWSASEELENTLPNSRIIATYDGSQGVPFRFDAPGLNNGLKDMLDANWATDDTNARNLLNYLRGDNTNEEKNGGTYRNRVRILGDIVHSSPLHKDGYLYAGGNDGMLHAFLVEDGTEAFAYVPKLVFENLEQLADPLYTHKFYVDLTPAVAEVILSGTDKTMLVGGLGKGGRGYYALDITNPDDITAESILAGRVMWEYPNDSTLQSEIDDMGYSFSRAAIVNSKAGWIVIVGNGYNSASGVAKLLILDAATGTLIKSISTGFGDCNGLSVPVPIDVDYDGMVDYVYAGDLKGNMWKFDFTVPANGEPGFVAGNDPEDYWDVAYKSAPYTYPGVKLGTTPAPLFQAKSLSGPQPITSKPDVMVHPEKEGYLVVFGTGKYLGDSDVTDNSRQTIYGIWDYGDDEDDSEYLGSFERGSTPQLSNQPNYSVNLLQQLDVECDPDEATCDGLLFTVGDVNLRVTTEFTPDWATTSKLQDASCGEGLGTEACEPNDYGENPDPVKNAGWYYDLPITGERVITDSLIRDGKAIMVAYTPIQSPCGSGGSSIIMEMNASAGGRLAKPQFDINDDGVIDDNDLVNIGTDEEPEWVAPTGLESEGRLFPPAILKMDNEREIKYFSSSKGKIVEVTEKAAKLGLSYWIELD